MIRKPIPVLGVAAAIGLGVLVSPAAARGQVNPDPVHYDFHPKSVLTLGAGFSPNNVGEIKRDCIKAEHVALDPGALNTVLKSDVVFTTEQLRTVIGIDSKIDANYLDVAGGSGRFSYNFSSLFREDSLNIVLTASTEYGRQGLKAADLTPEALAIRSDGKKFEAMCGSRYVAIEHRGASVSVILTIYNVARDVKTSVQAEMSAHGGYGPISGSVSTSIQSELTSAAASKRLALRVVATGGEGLSALQDLVASQAAAPDSLDKILAAVGGYLKDFKSTNAAPIGFDVASMANFGWDSNSVDLWGVLQERRLRAMVTEFRTIAAMLDSASNIKAGNDVRLKVLSKADAALIVAAIPAMEDYLGKIAASHKACRTEAQATCDLPQRPQLPALSEIPSPPRVQFLVKADGEFLDSVTSRAIVGDGRYSLIERTKKFRPTTKVAASYLVIDGEYMQAIYITNLGGVPNDPKHKEILFESSTDEKGLGSRIIDHMFASKKGDSVVFSVAVADQFGRQVEAPFFKATWDIQPHSTNITAVTLFP